jgi:hypothetical protein
VKRWQACRLAVQLVVWPGWSIALAEKIPSPDALEQLSALPVTLSVIEPHLSTPEHPVAVDYLAFPAPVVISAAVGPEWEAKTKTIEFRAFDGYVSRIDIARLANGKTYMASLAPTDRPSRSTPLLRTKRTFRWARTTLSGTTEGTLSCSRRERGTGRTR